MSTSSRNKSHKTKAYSSKTAKVEIPPYLSSCVWHYYEDIWCTNIFDEKLIVQLMAEGFLPIACKKALLPKLHKERCIIRWPNFHISKSTKKKCKRWNITINQEFDQVVKGCHSQHGESWLHPPIVKAFRAIHKKGLNGLDAMIVKNNKINGKCPVKLFSVEIWNAESGKLVAGELGYAFGNIYTSLTGFSAEDSAGSAQLVALGTILQKAGFVMWDLGMYLEYKEKLGAHLMPRADFIEEVRKAREEAPEIILSCPEQTNIKDILQHKPDEFAIHSKKHLVTNNNTKQDIIKSDQNQGKRSRDISPTCVQSLANKNIKKKS